MDFLDRSGHLFNLPSYSYEPIGHEFEENDYVFWVDNSKMNKLSINNYYIRTIYLAIPFDRIPKYGDTEDYDFSDSEKEEIVRNHPMIDRDKDNINDFTKYIDNIVVHDEYKFDETVKVTITSQSSKFCLIRPSDIQELVNGAKNIADYFEYNLNNDNKLTSIDSDNDDLSALIFTSEDEFDVVKDDEEKSTSLRKHTWTRDNYAIIPIYVLSMSQDEGTWLTNLLIHVENKVENVDENGVESYFDSVDEDWCSITVGGEFDEENEFLYINGKNMGIELPKEILRSVYQASFINNEFNEELYNEKLKEYLMNYMQIRGEIGNYNSVINSLKWFGYGDKITISKLIRTDNEFKYQFIRDYFNITTDILKSFEHFQNSAYISLSIKENNETGNYHEHKITNTVFGEGTPELEDNFKKLVETKYDYNNEKFTYLKPYYDFTFYEMGLKLACLKYYYKKYFLPLHLKIHSAAIEHKVYTNDIKFNTDSFKTILSEHPILLGNINERQKVLFEKSQVKYFIQSERYVDHQFNEFYSFDENKDVYYIDDTCLSIPIRFVNDFELVDQEFECGCKCHGKIKKEIPTYFNCVLLLEKEYYIRDTKLPYRMEFNHTINIFKDEITVFNKDTKRKEDLNQYHFSFALVTNDNKDWSQWIVGYDNLKQYLLDSSLVEIYAKDFDTDPTLSELENESKRRDESTTQIEIYNEYLYSTNNESSLVQVAYAINAENITVYDRKLSDWLEGHKELEQIARVDSVYHIGSEYNTNDSTYLGIKIKEYEQEIITDDFYLKIPSIKDLRKNPINMYDISADIIFIPKMWIKMKYDNTEIYDFKINGISYKKDVTINFVKETSLIYESHFSFVQNPDDPTTIYHSFILYPKLMNNHDINFFVNQQFKLKLLVNDQWYEYKFVAKMTDLDIQFGKLIYGYWGNDNKFISRFRQLSDQTVLDTENPENSKIHFNSFMYEPSLVEVNDINHLRHIENYINKYNVVSVNDYVINGNKKFSQYIVYKGVKIFGDFESLKTNVIEKIYKINSDTGALERDMFGNLIYTDDAIERGRTLENTDLFSIGNEEIEQAYDKDRLDPTIFAISPKINMAKRQLLSHQQTGIVKNLIKWEYLYKKVYWEEYDPNIYSSLTELLKLIEKEEGQHNFFYDEEQKRYYIDYFYLHYTYVNQTGFHLDIDSNDIYYYDEDGKKVICELHQCDEYFKSLKQSFDTYLNNYVSTINLPYNRNYLNNIQLYDIYENQSSVQNIFKWTKFTNVCCNGVLFYHKNDPLWAADTKEFKDTSIMKENTLTMSNAIRVSGTPLWDEDIYSNDVDLYSNYTNYDITMKDGELYDLENRKYKIDRMQADYDKDKYPFDDARFINIADSQFNQRDYTFYYFEDFTGKRYYTVEDLTNDIWTLTKFNNDHNNAHIQISNLFGMYAICPQNGVDQMLIPRPEEYDDDIALKLDPLYMISVKNNQNLSFDCLDEIFDKYNAELDFSKQTHVCDLYVKSLSELSSLNTEDIDFNGLNVKWCYENNFTPQSTSIKRHIIAQNDRNYAYFIMDDYNRFIYRPNDSKESIEANVNQIFKSQVFSNNTEITGLLLYYKLSYAELESVDVDENGNEVKYNYRDVNKEDIDITTIHQLAIGNVCGKYRICVHLYYNMSKMTFIADRYCKQVVYKQYNEDGTLNQNIFDVTSEYENTWKQNMDNIYNNETISNIIKEYDHIEKNGRIIYPDKEKVWDNLSDYFMMTNIVDNIEHIRKYDPNGNCNPPTNYNILLGNVSNIVYINEHNNEIVPDPQPGQYLYTMTLNDYNNDFISNKISLLNENSMINGYERGIINLNNIKLDLSLIDKEISEEDRQILESNEVSYNVKIRKYLDLLGSDTDYADKVRSVYKSLDELKSTINDYYKTEYPRESLRVGENLERMDDYNFEQYENVYTIKTITNESGELTCDFDLYFDPEYYGKLKDADGNFLEQNEDHNKRPTETNDNTFIAQYEDIYHKDKYRKNKIWLYTYYSPKYIKENFSIICITRHADGTVERRDIGYYDYLSNDKNVLQNRVFHINKTDTLSIYLRIKIVNTQVELKYGVANRVRVPEFFVVPVVFKKTEVMQKLRYKKVIKEYSQNYENLWDALLNDPNMTSEDFNKYFNKQNSQLYTEFFEEKYLIRDEDNSIFESIDKETYDIERLYDLEKQYRIWSQGNTLKETPKRYDSLMITDGQHGEMYFDINTKDSIQIDWNSINTIDKTNLVNFAKYRYAIEKDGDFYQCRAFYHYGEVILNDYVYNKKYTKFISPKVNIDMYLDYDMYLMHDNDYWYAIFISQDTINKVDNDAKLNVLDEQKTLLCVNSSSLTPEERKAIQENNNRVENSFYHNFTPYELRYVKSNNDFLINRMKFISSEGVNKFNDTDIIAGNITNNHRLPVHVVHSSKWRISPMSYGINYSNDVNSNSEMCILSYPQKNNNIEHGYYDVTVRYSLDRNVNHQYNKKAKLMIK